MARKAKGLTLIRLASEAGVHENTLGALERGTDHNFGLETITAVLVPLGLDLSITQTTTHSKSINGPVFSAGWSRERKTAKRHRQRPPCHT